MRILLIEDDTSTAKSVESIFKREGYVVDSTDLGEDGLDIAKLYDYDIILLDLMLPDIDGCEVLRRLRVARVKTPVIVVSGFSEPDKVVRAFGFRADHYVRKPFDKGELIARVQAVTRRFRGFAESVIRIGKLSINLDTQAVEVDDNPLHLTGKEYGILELLCLRKGNMLAKEVFVNHLYGGMDDEPGLKIVDVFVCKLRKKLKAATGGENYIKTVWGRGYFIQEPTLKPGHVPENMPAEDAVHHPGVLSLRDAIPPHRNRNPRSYIEREDSPDSSPKAMRMDGLILDPDTLVITGKKGSTLLNRKMYGVLDLLVRRRGKSVGVEALHELLHGRAGTHLDANIYAYISRLRTCVARVTGGEWGIKSVGGGYTLLYPPVSSEGESMEEVTPTEAVGTTHTARLIGSPS